MLLLFGEVPVGQATVESAGCSQQATVRAGPSGTAGAPSTGSFRAHGSNAFGQRGWNAQPVGSDRRSGGDPPMPVS
jgi:hypothetical protein